MLKRSVALGTALVLPGVACGTSSTEPSAQTQTSGNASSVPTQPPAATAQISTPPATDTAPTETVAAEPTPAVSPVAGVIPGGAEMVVEFTYTQGAGGKNLPPYIAVWVEDADGELVETIALWFQQDQKGPRWLPDLKRWFRKEEAYVATGGVDENRHRVQRDPPRRVLCRYLGHGRPKRSTIGR